MFAIINKNKQYLTRRGIDADYTFTDNNNFAYVWGRIEEAETVRNILTDYQGITDLEIIII